MPNANTPKLTDAQLIILSSAAQQDDRVAVLPDRLKGRAQGVEAVRAGPSRAS